jgi:hypothetical protein
MQKTDQNLKSNGLQVGFIVCMMLIMQMLQLEYEGCCM